MAEIQTALSVKGWAGVISSTHSHRTTITHVKRGNWDKYRIMKDGEEGLPGATWSR